MNYEHYTGSTVEIRAKQYCSEDISLIENYALAKADNFKGWCCHHRLEFLPCLQRWVSKNELLEKGLYFNRPSWELIFMKIGEHKSFHSKDPKWKAKTTEATRNSEKRKKAAADATRNSEKHKKAARLNIKKAYEAIRKPFVIDGIQFERLLDAARHFNVSQNTISRWLNGKKKTDHQCRYTGEV